MGLDIVARRNVKKVDPSLYEGFDADADDSYDVCKAKGWFTVLANDAFPIQAEGIEANIPYSCDDDNVRFRAGSYSSYNCWRNELAVLAGFDSAEEVWSLWDHNDMSESPFVEMINFSDCEGVIGQNVCRKLAKDFNDFHDKLDSHECTFVLDEYFRDTFNEFRDALNYAGDNGVLVFC